MPLTRVDVFFPSFFVHSMVEGVSRAPRSREIPVDDNADAGVLENRRCVGLPVGLAVYPGTNRLHAVPR